MLQYPNYGRALQTQFLTLKALRIEEERYRQLRAESIVGNEVFNDLMRALAQRRRAAETRPKLDLGLKRQELVERVPMFAALDPQKRAKLARRLRPRLAVPGEAIVRKGDRGDEMFIISSGAVEVRLAPQPVRLGSGAFFGELALLDNRPRSTDVVALGYCQLLRLSRRDLNRLMHADDGLRQQIQSVAGERRTG
jgi:CPA1 family monovalent cation:H+ antiporter